MYEVILALMGSSFTGARSDGVSYQILFFFLGPTGLGKSELKRIIKLLFGNGMCMQPDLNVWGQKFSSGTPNVFYYFFFALHYRMSPISYFTFEKTNCIHIFNTVKWNYAFLNSDDIYIYIYIYIH